MIIFGMMMTSLCTQYWQVFLAQGLVVGVGGGCLFIPSIAVIPRYFFKRKALAMGLASSGVSVGKRLRLSNDCPVYTYPWGQEDSYFQSSSASYNHPLASNGQPGHLHLSCSLLLFCPSVP